MKKPHRLSICATSIAAFLAASPESPGVNYHVFLGDTQIEGGVVTGGTGLTKTGGGTLVLGNAGNNYTGQTTISNGSIVISNGSALGTDPSAIVVTGFNPTIGQVNNVRSFGGGSLVLNGLAGGFTLARDLSLQGQGPIADRGGALISLGDNTLSGAVSVNQPSFGSNVNTTLISVGGTLTFSGSLNVLGTAGTTLATLGGVNQGGVTNYHLTGPLTGTGTLSKAGGGTLFLNPASTGGFSGSIRVNGFTPSGQSSVRISTPNVLGTRIGAGTTAVLDLNGGILEVLMDAPSVLQAGTAPANVYARFASTIFVDKGVGGTGINGTVNLGQFAFEEMIHAFNGRNGYGISFSTAPVQGGTNNVTFSNNLQGGLLAFTGNFWSNTDNTGNRILALTGSGDMRIDGSIVASAATFNHSFLKLGSGLLTVTGTATTLDGDFTIQAGTVATRRIVGGILGTGTSTGALNLQPGTLDYLGAVGSGAGETVSRSVFLGATTGGGRINANQTGSAATPLIFNGPITAANGSKTLTLGGASPLDNEIQSALSSPATGVLSLAKVDASTWVLSGTNTYTGTTTISNGTLKLKANNSASTVLSDSSPLAFNADNATQSAGGRLLFTGFPLFPTTETVGLLNPVQGHGTVRVENGGAQTTLAIGGFTPQSASLAASVNFEAPGALDVITLGGAAGFVGGHRYFNGAHFAYADGGGVLRAPVYNSDIGFVASLAALTTNFHNDMIGSFVSAGGNVSSLRMNGSQTLTLTGPLTVSGVGSVGGLLVSGGNAAITTSGAGSLSGPVLSIRVDQPSDSLTLGVPIAATSTFGLAKNGRGTLILAAANNQTGTTNLHEGTIQLAPGGRLSAPNQGLIIRQGATLDLNGVTQPATTIAAFNGAGTVTNSSATPAELAIGNNTGAGTFSGTIQDGVGRVNVLKQSTNDVNFTGLNTYTGTTTIASSGAIQVTNLGNIGEPSGIGRGDATNAATNADSLVFVGAQPVSPATGATFPSGLVYLGTSTVSTDRLFRLGAGGSLGAGARLSANSANNAGLVFSNPAPIGYTPAGSTATQTLVLAGASTADNRINLQLVNSGAVGGSLGVTKLNNGKWVLGNPANSYTRATKIHGGALEATDGASLPASSPLLIAGTLTTPAGGVLETSGTFTRPVSAGTVANTVNFNANGNFAGSGGFAASGDSLTVNLGGASAPLTWGVGGFLMPGTSAATLRLSSPTALGEVDFQNPIALGAAQRTLQVDDNLNIAADFATLSGALSGVGGGITKTGPGVLALTGASTYTGATVIETGTLVVRSLGHSSSPGATSVGDSGLGNTNTGAVVLGNGSLLSGILQYVGPGETSDRKLRLNSTANPTQIHADGGGPLILTNVANDLVTSATILSLRGTNAGGNRIDNILTNSLVGTGALTVTIDGSATWILNAANTHSGNTNSNAGALGLGNDNALGTSTLVLNNGNLFASGGDRTIANPVTLLNNTTQGFLGDHSLTFTQPLSNLAAANNNGINNNLAAGKALTFAGMTANLLSANRVLTIDGPGETVFNGTISNLSTTAFGLNITKTGTGLLVLNDAGGNFAQNNATLDIDAGTVRLGAANALLGTSTSAANVNFSPDTGQNETATLNLNGFSQTIRSLTTNNPNSSATTIDNAAGAAVTLTIGTNNGAVNFNGAITASGGGAISLVKTGTGAGVLSGTNIVLSGTTTVQTGGSLAFTGDDPNNTTGITVAGGAGLRLINGAGSSFASLTALSLGVGGGATALGLDVGTITDTLAIAAAATTQGQVNLSIGAAPGFGGSPTYTLLQAGSGLSGALYALNGVVPGGYTYSLITSDTAVILNATAGAGGNFFWRGDLSGSWSTYNSGNTNWEDSGGDDPAAIPGPLDVVVFSSVLSPPSTAVVTTLDQPIAIDSLQFNGSTVSAAGARVNIAPGLGGTLTIYPASVTDGIELPDNGGVASITAPISLGGDQTWTVGSVGAPRPELVVSGVLSGTGDLTKLGSGTATVTGTSTRTGRTAIDAGTLRINAEAALGGNPASAVADQLSLDGGTLRSTAAFVIDDTNRGITLGALGGAFDTTGGNITIASVIAGVGGLRKTGTGFLILDGANTYAGGTTIGASVIRIGSDTAMGTGPLTVNGAGTIVEYANGVVVANDVTVADLGNDKTFRLLPGAASATHTGNISVAETTIGNFRLQASAGGTLTVAGAISALNVNSTAGVRVNELAGNTGVLVLSGANTYLGPTEIRQGTLRNGASEVIPNNVIVNAFIGGQASSTATYDIANHNETISALTFGAVASSNAANVNVVTGSTGTLTLEGNVTTIAANPGSRAELQANVQLAATRTFSVADALNEQVDFTVGGVLAGPGAITKAGLGTMKIRGMATYSGVTTINAGTLLVSGSISGGVVVAGGTLGGTGTVGPIGATSGTVSPGESIGTLTASSLTMSGSSSFKLEIDTAAATHDLLNTSGPLALLLGGTPLTITDLGGNFALTEGARFRFLTYSGGRTGLFSIGGNAIDDDLEFFTIGANTFALDYNDLGGTAVSLVVVPEPGIAASLLGGAGLLAGLRRFRRGRR